MFTNPLLQSSHTGSTPTVLSIREILFSVLCLDSLAMLSCPCAAAQRPPQKRHCHGQLPIEHSATASSPHSSLFFNRGLESMAFMKVPMFLPVSSEAWHIYNIYRYIFARTAGEKFSASFYLGLHGLGVSSLWRSLSSSGASTLLPKHTPRREVSGPTSASIPALLSLSHNGAKAASCNSCSFPVSHPKSGESQDFWEIVWGARNPRLAWRSGSLPRGTFEEMWRRAEAKHRRTRFPFATIPLYPQLAYVKQTCLAHTAP